MGKMNELSAAVTELKKHSNAILDLSKTFENFFSIERQSEIKQLEFVTLEQVRAVLAEKSRVGHTDAIRELLIKHGAKKLSEIDPEKYPLLLADAEALENG